MNTINTPQGEVKLLAPPGELLRTIRSFLPFGAVRYAEPENVADFGIVMQCGDQEVYAVKQQPVPCDEKHGYVLYQAHSLLIANSLAEYLRNGFEGLFMPCAYIRKKDEGKVESGIAYFGFPSQTGRESQDFPFQDSYDTAFGHGFTTMMKSFIIALQQSSRDMRIPLFEPIGLDIRPRMHLGALGFGFMIIGPHIVCLKTTANAKDPVWALLREKGVTEVFHIPSIPATILESDLRTAKPTE